MQLTNEMIVAIIGAGAAVIGAIFSTISIVLSNKNNKKIKWLENSKNVKQEIADTRYKVYSKIIDYINSYYDTKPYYQHNYLKCKAKLYSVDTNRLNTSQKIEEELTTLQSLSLQYFYLDKKTYWCLKSAESLLSAVLNYIANEKIENFNLLARFIYEDLWTYMFIISKSVNSFISCKDPLDFKPSKKFNHKFGLKLFKKSKFYKLVYNSLIYENYITKFNNKKKQQQRKITKLENDMQQLMDKPANKKVDKRRKRHFKKIQTLKSKIKKSKPPKKYTKNIDSKIYKIWKNCNTCLNKDCPINKKSCSK